MSRTQPFRLVVRSSFHQQRARAQDQQGPEVRVACLRDAAKPRFAARAVLLAVIVEAHLLAEERGGAGQWIASSSMAG